MNNESESIVTFTHISFKMEENTDIKPNILNTAQKARMERNRLKALSLKESKLIPHPTALISCPTTDSVVRVAGASYRDTGGGFLLEDSPAASAPAPVRRPAPLVHVSEQPHCMECERPFPGSYLYDTFDYDVCDECRDPEDKHSLITRTEAKNEYLLKDCDLDDREPPLRFVTRKNPHNPRWGSMKLYLHAQVELRALLVWGSEDALLAERARREEWRGRVRRGKYAREMRELRMRVRGSLFEGARGGAGAGAGAGGGECARRGHRLGAETALGGDAYSAVCERCGLEQTFEKM